jgi:hypothetical protein
VARRLKQEARLPGISPDGEGRTALRFLFGEEVWGSGSVFWIQALTIFNGWVTGSADGWRALRDATYQRLDVPGGGSVETWWGLTEVKGDYVSYRRTYVFTADGATVTSDSTRRFWSRAEIEGSLRSAGYTLVDVHDAPDRPGFEWIFIARKPGSAS